MASHQSNWGALEALHRDIPLVIEFVDEESDEPSDPPTTQPVPLFDFEPGLPAEAQTPPACN